MENIKQSNRYSERRNRRAGNFRANFYVGEYSAAGMRGCVPDLAIYPSDDPVGCTRIRCEQCPEGQVILRRM